MDTEELVSNLKLQISLFYVLDTKSIPFIAPLKVHK